MKKVRQCPSCGGGCKKSGCERENLKMNPQKREWVGLTDDEIDKWNIVGNESLREFVRSLEAKLKEKNT